MKQLRKIALLLIIVALLTCVMCACDDDADAQTQVPVTIHLNDGTATTVDKMFADMTTYTPTREGYNFAGWSFDVAGEQAFDGTIDNSTLTLTLYAQWTIKKYNVTFYVENNGNYVPFTQEVEHGKNATPPSLEDIAEHIPAGSEFVGWGDESAYQNVTNNVDVIAIINKISKTVVFMNGNEQVAQKSGFAIATLELPQAPTAQNGFEFAGWVDGEGVALQSGATYGDAPELLHAKYVLSKPASPTIEGFTEITYGTVLELTATPSAQEIDGLTYTYAWLDSQDNVLSNTNELDLNRLSAGTHIVNLSYTVSCDGYESVSATQLSRTIEVAKKNLSATFSLNLNYGDALPSTIDVDYDGFVYEDDETLVKGTQTVQSTYQRGTNVGTYNASIEGLYFDNYTINSNDKIESTLTVSPLEVSVELSFDGVYSGSTLTKSYTSVLAEGLLEGHTLDVSFTTTASNVGTYELITGEKASLQLGLVQIKDGQNTIESGNYNVSYNVVANITPATIAYARPSVEDCTFTFDNTLHSADITLVTQDTTVTYSVDNETYTSTLPAFDQADVHRVFFKIERENYTTVSDYFDITIAKANVSFIAQPQSTTYGEVFTLNQTAINVIGNTYGIDLAPTLHCDYQTGDNAGTYEIEINTIGSDNFNITSEKSTLTVSAKQLVVSIKAHRVTYGEAFDLTKVTADLVGLVDGDDAQIVYATSYQAGDSAGSKFDVTIAEVKNANYTLTQSQNGTLAVDKRAISLTVDNKSVTYGEALEGEYSYTVTNGTIYDSDSLNGTYQCAYQVGTDVGTLEIGYTPQNNNYQVSVTKGTLAVNARELAITIDDKSVVYGEAFAGEYTYSIASGSIYGSDDLQLAYTCDYQASDVNVQAIGATSGNANYDVTVSDGTMMITARTLTISYVGTKALDGDVWSIVYSSANASNGITGLYWADTLSGTLATKSAEDGTYTDFANFEWTTDYTISNGEQDVTALYSVEYILSVTISTELIEHKATGNNAQYDGVAHGGSVVVTDSTAQNVAITYSTNNVDFASELPTYTNVGTYIVYYLITADERTATSGSFTVNITKRNATITALAQSATYGEAFTLDTTKFETTDVLDGDLASLAISLESVYTVGSDAGEYAITVNYTANDNYQIATTAGTLTVDKAVVSVSYADANVTYGDTFVASGLSFVESSNDTVANEFFTAQCAYKQGDGVGEYAITVTSSNSNYLPQANDAKLIVSPRKITVKANDTAITYGEEATFGYQIVSGALYSTDTIDVTFECDGVDVSETGYAITPVVAIHANYDVTVQTGTLTITKAPLMAVFAQVGSITYGEAQPAFTITQYVGYVGNDSADTVAINGTLVTTSNYMSAKAAGTYSVTATGLSADNYVIIYPALSFTVEKATLNVTVDAIGAITYGDARPELTYTATGFKFDDDESLLDGISVDCAYQQGSNAGKYSYNVNLNGFTLNNYTIVVGAAQELVVNKANYQGIQNTFSFSGTYNANTSVSAGYPLSTSYSYVDANEIPTVAKTVYNAYYNADPTNYNNYAVSVTITLAKASVEIFAQDSSTNWTGSALDVATFVGATCDNTDHGTVTYSPTSVTDGGIYTITLTSAESANYLSATKTIKFSVKAATIGGAYYTVEDALATGGDIVLVGNAFLSAGNYTLNNTLYMYYDGVNLNTDNTAYTPSYYTGAPSLLLTIKSGANITVNGNLSVGGITGSAGSGQSGHTSGKYAQITMESNSAITVKSGGKIYSYGYIKGDGAITYESGASSYSPFVVRDFKGGSATVALYQGGLISSSKYLSPFCVYEMPNIQPTQTFMYGSSLNALCDLYADDKHNKTTSSMIGTSDSLIIMTSNSSKVIIDFVPKGTNGSADNLTYLHIYGDTTFGSMQLEVKASIITASVDTADIVFPVSYLYNIQIHSGTTTTANRYKLMPGASLTVDSGATLTFKGTQTTSWFTTKTVYAGIMVYDSTFVDQDKVSPYPSGKGNASLIINGTLKADQYVQIGGIIQSNTANAKVIIGSDFTNSMKQDLGYNDSTSFVDTGDYTLTAQLSGYSGTVSASTTYTYNGSTWA